MKYRKNNTVQTKAYIDLDNMVNNYRRISKKIAPAQLIAVVKADGYGHGAVRVAKKLQEEGVEYFAVARLSEAIELNEEGINGKILILGRIFPEEIKYAVKNKIRITLTNQQDLKLINQKAKELDKTAILHINIDTGMGRVGILTRNAVDTILKAKDLSHIEVEGVYSHFSTADQKDKMYAKEQFQKFSGILAKLEQENISISCKHIANSGAILDLPETYTGEINMVRAGIMLYGAYPSLHTSESIPVDPVMTMTTKVSEIRTLPGNYSVSYGRRYKTPKKMKTAVLPIGYADGIHRIHTGKSKVMIKGKLYPMIGTVTMDQIVISVDNKVEQGDKVILWGDVEEDRLRASRVAEKIGTISYELFTSISKRVPRIYNSYQK